MIVKGFRTIGLTPKGEIPNEIGEKHYFSLSQERAEWWARALPLDGSVPSRGYEIAMYGYAIMVVEAEDVQKDGFFPDGEDFDGRIISARPVKIVNYIKKRKKKSFWRNLRSFLHLIFKSTKFTKFCGFKNTLNHRVQGEKAH